MGQFDGQRHEILCLIACVPKHHPLVASTLFALIATHHASPNIGALLLDGREYATAISVEEVFALVVLISVTTLRTTEGSLRTLTNSPPQDHHLPLGHECLAHATFASASWARKLSKIASEIWSATLSG